MRRTVGTVLTILLAVVASAEAQDTKSVEPVVVTATTVATPAQQLGVALSVIPGEDFRTYQYPALDDAFRNIPGVTVTQQGSYGKVSTLSIRGANANQVLILVDGVRVSSPTLGQTDLSDISPEQIERIEVIRGPQSTLYGADAIGGVVNIITRKGTGRPFTGSVETSAGNYDTLQNRISLSGAYKIFDYALSGFHFESNGQFKNDDSNVDAGNLRFGVSLPFDSSLSVVYRYNKTDTGVPIKGVFPPPQPIVPIINPNAKQQSETTVLSVEGRTRPVEWWESRARFGRYTGNQGFQDPPDPGVDFDVLVKSQVDVERLESEWLNSFFLGKWSTSTVGVGYRNEEGNNQGVFRASRHVPWGLFEEQLRFFDRLFITGGSGSRTMTTARASTGGAQGQIVVHTAAPRCRFDPLAAPAPSLRDNAARRRARNEPTDVPQGLGGQSPHRAAHRRGAGKDLADRPLSRGHRPRPPLPGPAPGYSESTGIRGGDEPPPGLAEPAR